MLEIPDLKADYSFLKKFDRHGFDVDFSKIKKSRRSNFSRHPKQLDTDSESSLGCAGKFSSGTIVKEKIFIQEDHDFQSDDSAEKELEEIFKAPTEDKDGIGVQLSKFTSVASNPKIPLETAIGDAPRVSATTITKKTKKSRPSSVKIVDNFDKKFTAVVEKTLKLLNDIRVLIEKGISLPDGEEEHNRRLKRQQEFSSRFSRVYLYPLLKQTNELSGNEKINIAMASQKILYAHQLISQGLQAYLTHLPVSLGNCCSDKLKNLLEQIVYLCQIHELIRKTDNTDNNEYINALRTHTELLMEAVDTFNLKFLELMKSAENKNKVKKEKPKTKVKSKLGMYNESASFRRDVQWRKAVESLAKKKFNVKSRYRTATFKHRPPVEKPHFVELPSKTNLFPKRSSGFLSKSTPLCSPVREEEIETMVEVAASIKAPANSVSEIVNHGDGEEQLVRDGDVKRALRVLREHLDVGNEDLDRIERRLGEAPRKKNYRPPVVTVSGTKNAQLICIKDENSIVEDIEDERKDKEVMTDKEIKVTSSETQTEIKERAKKIRSTTSSIKISRLPKSEKALKLLPKDYAINVIQYKLLYHNYCKPNPMYRKTSSVQPWVLMGQISDEILDEIIASVSEELEVNEVLQHLYDAEFQY